MIGSDMRNFRVCIVSTGLFLFLSFTACGESVSAEDKGLVDAVTGIITDLTQDPEVRLCSDPWTSLTFGVGYRGFSLFPGVETLVWFTLGGDLSSAGYYRYPDGREYTGGDYFIDPSKDPFYYYFNVHWSFGISQGILWNKQREKNLLEGYFFYRVHTEIPLIQTPSTKLIYRSGLPEADGRLLTYFIGGINYDSVYRRPGSRVREGVRVDLGGSWAPDYALNRADGIINYYGLHADFRLFLPYGEIVSKKGKNIFSVYHGFWLRGDYVFGPHIPLLVLQHFPGRDWKKGMGAEGVRGVDKNRFPAPLKVLASNEVRFQLPSLGISSLIPGLVLFFDAGYYRFTESALLEGPEAGVLLSTGGGVFFDLFGLGEIAFYAEYFINGTKVDGTKFTPFEFFFGLHF